MPTQLDVISEFISKQLNDHDSSPRGAVQPTYYAWTESHIHDAISQGVAYLYGIKPSLFSEKKCHLVTEKTCVIDLKKDCCNVLSILGVGSDCDNVVERGNKTNNLMCFMKPLCVASSDTPEYGAYSFEFKGEGLIQFSEPIEKNTLIWFVCSTPPSSADSIPDCIFTEYKPLIVPFALWYLLLTDNESRSNPERWNAYYQQVRDFVTLKLRIEFSLRTDQFLDGLQKPPDRQGN